MKSQLAGAQEAGHKVQKVILIGGFAASRSLRNYLERQYLSGQIGYEIKLTGSLRSGEQQDMLHAIAQAILRSDESETAVAHGAILRAWNKEEGPLRIIQSSYGFEITELYEPHIHPAHKSAKPKFDKLDGASYVHNVLDWAICKGFEVPYHKEYKQTVYQIFAFTRTTFTYKQTLWVSDTCTESHYRSTNIMNKNKAEVAGEISVDFKFLIDQKKVNPIEPEEGYVNKKHYKIEFELVLIVDGRNMRCEARWPVGGESLTGDKATTQISIAAAFKPGTK